MHSARFSLCATSLVFDKASFHLQCTPPIATSLVFELYSFDPKKIILFVFVRLNVKFNAGIIQGSGDALSLFQELYHEVNRRISF